MCVNVEGTRCLMRYLIDRGCEKFVFASTIAIVGMQNVEFRPVELPMPDEHPCLDRDGYGFSKHLMEEVTRYYQRQNDRIDVIHLRLSATVADDARPPLVEPGPVFEWAAGSASIMLVSDAVRALVLAAEAPTQPGVRVMNACPPLAWVKAPVAEVLRSWYGREFDVSYYERPGHEWDSLYDVRLIKRELGFVAEHLPGDIWPDDYAGPRTL